jgi:4-carboxymuconolactone decarboxylase
MPRYSSPDPASLTPRQKEVYEAIASSPRGRVRGPLAVWLARPELADRAQNLGRYCRYDSSLPPVLSELAILVTARHWSAEFEWQAHKPFALAAGLPPAAVDAIRDRQPPQWADAAQQVVYDFATALLERHEVGDEIYDRAVELLGREGVVDLTGVLGYYGMVSMTLRIFEVPPLEGVPVEMGG